MTVLLEKYIDFSFQISLRNLSFTCPSLTKSRQKHLSDGLEFTSLQLGQLERTHKDKEQQEDHNQQLRHYEQDN
jgi:hypothetical protein